MHINNIHTRHIYTENYLPFPSQALQGTFVDRFEDTVNRFPDHLAVNDVDREFTYHDLNEEANRLAWQILENREPAI